MLSQHTPEVSIKPKCVDYQSHIVSSWLHRRKASGMGIQNHKVPRIIIAIFCHLDYNEKGRWRETMHDSLGQIYVFGLFKTVAEHFSLPYCKYSILFASIEKHKVERTNISSLVIFRGMTSMPQPFDVYINKPFKNLLRKVYETWLEHVNLQLTIAGR